MNFYTPEDGGRAIDDASVSVAGYRDLLR